MSGKYPEMPVKVFIIGKVSIEYLLKYELKIPLPPLLKGEKRAFISVEVI
jgi:hypothetical protein